VKEASHWFHASLWGEIRKSGLPVHWPVLLGGWGVPGELDAPPIFRKAAAVALTDASHDFFNLGHALTSTLPDKVQQRVDAIVKETLDRFPPGEDQEDNIPLIEVRDELLASVGGILRKRLAPSSKQGKYMKLPQRVRRVISSVKITAAKWQSVQPASNRAIQAMLAKRGGKLVSLRPLDPLRRVIDSS
jgi:hypothetical protein